MFNSLSERLSKTLQSMGQKARLTEDNIASTLKEVRKALLEADVALPVVKQFISRVRTRALGREVRASLTPGQQFLKVVQSELEAVLGGPSESLNLAQRPPAIILLAGLQGAGKTTTAAKLAKILTNREKKKVLLVSVDVYRPVMRWSNWRHWVNRLKLTCSHQHQSESHRTCASCFTKSRVCCLRCTACRYSGSIGYR